jgi:hypothetical protein
MQRNYTTEDMRHHMDEHGVGFFEATNHFERRHFLQLLDIAGADKDIDLLCDVVRELVNRAKFI